jgi:hypothetical protein
MNVILLGAGASLTAGYPLARDLIDTVGREASASRLANYSTSWAEWQEYRNETSGLLRSLLYSPNPEVVLSVPDLFEAAIVAEDQAKFKRACNQFETDPEGSVANYKAYLDSEARTQLHKAVVARTRFLECLDWFFAFRHGWDAEHREQRGYLRELLDQLDAGDVVISLNWDTIAERTLGELGKWNPVNGYGFHKVLVHRAHRSANSHELPPDFPQSAVKVLKLHGSFGWLLRRNSIVFGHDEYLSYLRFSWNGTDLDLWDPQEVDSIGIPDSRVLLYPSFLKRIDVSELQRAWYRAAEALRQADQVDIWGYSLPESDTAVRTLLIVLRERSESGDLLVTIHDPKRETRERWQSFVGEKAKYRDDSLGPIAAPSA